jgi:putative hydrolase of the HAD superfamily
MMSAAPRGARPDSDPLRDIDFVYFDFAGTLVEGVPTWEHPQIVACAEAGRDVTPAEVKAAIWEVWGPIEGCTHVEASADEESYAAWIGAIERRILAGLNLPEAALDQAARRVMELQVAPRCYRVYSDVIPTLEALRARGLRLGVISNFAWRLPDLVDGLGLAGYFDHVLTSARSGYRKPRPEIFHQAIAAVGARPASTLYIGDDPVCDVQGAQSAGLRPVWLNRKGRDEDGPAYSVRGLDDLVRERTNS